MREISCAYQNAVAGEVARFEGHVAKFMGGGVLAYFGWPCAYEDSAERAVRAKLAINDPRPKGRGILASLFSCSPQAAGDATQRDSPRRRRRSDRRLARRWRRGSGSRRA
jgi:class 3 adenylate cyclase